MFADSPPPTQSTADGNNPNPHSASATIGDGEPSSPLPPAGPSGDTAAERSPSNPRSSPPRSAQQGGSSIYDLFLTAVGLTPRGLAADTFSQGGSGGEAEEEDFWSAHDEAGEHSAGAADTVAPAQQRTSAGTRNGTASGLGTGGGERQLYESQQPSITTTGQQMANRTTGATSAAAVAAPATQALLHHNGTAERPRSTSRTRQQMRSEADMERRYPRGESVSQAGSASLDAETVVAGTARRRRRLFSSNAGATSASGARWCTR